MTAPTHNIFDYRDYLSPTIKLRTSTVYNAVDRVNNTVIKARIYLSRRFFFFVIRTY